MATLTIQLDPDYLGSCAKTMSDPHDADHAEWVEFEPDPESDTRMAKFGLPPIRGVWHHVCAAHCDPTAKHR